ncbi:MAG: LptF/LptG family permease [Candidatus Competibacter sp.]
MVGLQAGYFLVVLVPLAFLLSVMLTLGRLYRDHEMVALAACGYGPLSVYRAVLLLAVPLAAGYRRPVPRSWCRSIMDYTVRGVGQGPQGSRGLDVRAGSLSGRCWTAAMWSTSAPWTSASCATFSSRPSKRMAT